VSNKPEKVTLKKYIQTS